MFDYFTQIHRAQRIGKSIDQDLQFVFRLFVIINLYLSHFSILSLLGLVVLEKCSRRWPSSSNINLLKFQVIVASNTPFSFLLQSHLYIGALSLPLTCILAANGKVTP